MLLSGLRRDWHMLWRFLCCRYAVFPNSCQAFNRNYLQLQSYCGCLRCASRWGTARQQWLRSPSRAPTTISQNSSRRIGHSAKSWQLLCYSTSSGTFVCILSKIRNMAVLDTSDGWIQHFGHGMNVCHPSKVVRPPLCWCWRHLGARRRARVKLSDDPEDGLHNQRRRPTDVTDEHDIGLENVSGSVVVTSKTRLLSSTLPEEDQLQAEEPTDVEIESSVRESQ
jgi:hypothetical protein